MNKQISILQFQNFKVSWEPFQMLILTNNKSEHFYKYIQSHIPKDKHMRDKVSKNGPSKICGRQPLKNLTWSILEYFVPFHPEGKIPSNKCFSSETILLHLLLTSNKSIRSVLGLRETSMIENWCENFRKKFHHRCLPRFQISLCCNILTQCLKR